MPIEKVKLAMMAVLVAALYLYVGRGLGLDGLDMILWPLIVASKAIILTLIAAQYAFAAASIAALLYFSYLLAISTAKHIGGPK